MNLESVIKELERVVLEQDTKILELGENLIKQAKAHKTLQEQTLELVKTTTKLAKVVKSMQDRGE